MDDTLDILYELEVLATNIFGGLSNGCKTSIRAYLNNPTFDGWAAICGIIMNNSDCHNETIWQ